MNENNNVNDNEDNSKIVMENNSDSDSDDYADYEEYDGDDYGDTFTLKKKNNEFKRIDEKKSFEDQMNILTKLPWLNEYWHAAYYEDNK